MNLGRWLVARLGPPMKVGLKARNWEIASDDDLLTYGEPFLLHPDPRINKVPLVRLFGAGRYWRARQEDGIDVVGQGLDLWSTDMEMKLVLDARRIGTIRGRWHSRYCPDGEIGERSFCELEMISEEVYDAAVAQLARRR